MFDLMRELAIESRSKIVLLVADGLGGLPREPGGPTELEAAATPHLDGLVARNVCGLSIPVAPGITPGSGPGHLGLFGYDPLACTDRPRRARGARHRLRAGAGRRRGARQFLHRRRRRQDHRSPRRPDRAARSGAQLVEKLRARPDRGRRDLRRAGQGLSLRAGDPRAGPRRRHRRHRPRDDRRAAAAGRRATIRPRSAPRRSSRRFIGQAAEILEDDHPANMITLRGIAKRPPIPQFEEVYRLRAGAIAVYPMYRGLARLVGMTIFSAGRRTSPTRSRRCAGTGTMPTSSSCTTSTPMPPARMATSSARSPASRSSTRRSRPSSISGRTC